MGSESKSKILARCQVPFHTIYPFSKARDFLQRADSYIFREVRYPEKESHSFASLGRASWDRRRGYHVFLILVVQCDVSSKMLTLRALANKWQDPDICSHP